jgi:hypothetical protein
MGSFLNYRPPPWDVITLIDKSVLYALRLQSCGVLGNITHPDVILPLAEEGREMEGWLTAEDAQLVRAEVRI